jgi:hypothetical protein
VRSVVSVLVRKRRANEFEPGLILLQEVNLGSAELSGWRLG